jgi:hypothetical protein
MVFDCKHDYACMNELNKMQDSSMYFLLLKRLRLKHVKVLGKYCLHVDVTYNADCDTKACCSYMHHITRIVSRQ